MTSARLDGERLFQFPRERRTSPFPSITIFWSGFAQVHEMGGGNYQTLINSALHEYMQQRKEPLEETLRRVGYAKKCIHMCEPRCCAPSNQLQHPEFGEFGDEFARIPRGFAGFWGHNTRILGTQHVFLLIRGLLSTSVSLCH